MDAYTPLLELTKIYKPENSHKNVKIYAKCEYQNSSGSVKDRAAKAMIIDGIQSGRLTKDKIITDATSGNTGIAYAMLGRFWILRLNFICPPMFHLNARK